MPPSVISRPCSDDELQSSIDFIHPQLSNVSPPIKPETKKEGLTQHRSAPFLQSQQLNDELDDIDPSALNGHEYLPGHPRVNLADVGALATFLENELCSPDLENMAPNLWMMSLRSSTNISPLHRQRVKGREILISEDPKLHLVWLPSRVHIKPLPTYLLSYAFWDIYLSPQTSPLRPQSRDRVLKAALGYLRTYYYLIKYESDFVLAQDACLVPKSVTWPEFCAFTSGLNSIPDTSVSSRYAFGELRLNRLNFYAKFVLRKYRLQYVHTSYGTYFARFYAPFLFIFGVITVMLNALQVGLQAEPLAAVKWPRFWDTARGFAIMALMFALILASLLLFLGLYRFVDEWQYAIRKEVSRKRHGNLIEMSKKNELNMA
jgi:hypothetical protein